MECDETFLESVERDLEAAWTLVGTEVQIPSPESWFVFEAAGRSLIVARDGEGRLGAFVNSCTHRGTRLCRGAGTGRLKCPYHGWVFGCDGRLLGAFRRAGLPAFNDEDLGLARLAVATVGTLIFVHSDPAAPDVRLALGEVAAELNQLGKPIRESLATVESGWREELDRSPDSGLRIPPNSTLLRHDALTTVTTFTPLSATSTRKVTRVFKT